MRLGKFIVFFCFLAIPFILFGEEDVTLIKSHESLDWRGWFTIVVFLLTFFALIKEIRPPDITMLVSAGVLVITGILRPEQFLAGFSKDIIVTIAMLCIIVRTLEIHAILHIVGKRMLSLSDNIYRQYLSYMVPVAGASAFMNNIPIVLLMTPTVRNWALRLKRNPSKYLIPLSYAAIVGGVCTIIGTSTNLVVEGMVRRYTAVISLGFFELAWIGLPCVVVVLLYMLFVGRHFLPERPDPALAMAEQTREFTTEFLVEEECPLANRSVVEVGQKYLRGQLLLQIERNNTNIDSPSGDLVIFVGDRLVFSGDVNQIAELHGIKGLKSLADPKFELDLTSSHFSEVVIPTTSLLVGKTLKQINFRDQYGASVFAVYREGWRVPGNVADVSLQAGDTLMLLSGEPWHGRGFYTNDFYYIRHSEKLQVFHPWRAFLVIGTLIGMVTAATMGMSIMIASLAAVFFLIFTRSITIREAQNSVVWNLLLLIACSFAVGKAMEVTGVALYFAKTIFSVVGPEPYHIVGGILFVTILGTELITNTAAAVILFPIAVQIVQLAGFHSPEAIKTMAVTIALGCSCCFAIPTGYQTHMIVFGPGGYRFTDFMKVGAPLDVLIWMIGTLLIPILWPLT